MTIWMDGGEKMTKLMVYESGDRVEEKVYLRLIDGDEEFIILVACDECGDVLPCGSILTIGPKGVHLCSNVSDKLGIATDHEGANRVVVLR